MGADLQGHREEGSQPPPYTVRVTFDPYNRDSVQDLLRNVRDEFGRNSSVKPGGRWYYTVTDEGPPNVWLLDFHFVDINDAMIFGLKYSR